MKKLICKKCGWKWFPRVTNPVECPRCHSYSWKGKMKVIPNAKKLINLANEGFENE